MGERASGDPEGMREGQGVRIAGAGEGPKGGLVHQGAEGEVGQQKARCTREAPRHQPDDECLSDGMGPLCNIDSCVGRMVRSGYLTSATNPNFSGLTKLIFRDELAPTDRTVYTMCHIESGFGMRQLVGAIGRNGQLVQESARIPLDYTIEQGLLHTFSLDEVPA